jgi:hypothetical protein
MRTGPASARNDSVPPRALRPFMSRNATLVGAAPG